MAGEGGKARKTINAARPVARLLRSENRDPDEGGD